MQIISIVLHEDCKYIEFYNPRACPVRYVVKYLPIQFIDDETREDPIAQNIFMANVCRILKDKKPTLYVSLNATYIIDS